MSKAHVAFVIFACLCHWRQATPLAAAEAAVAKSSSRVTPTLLTVSGSILRPDGTPAAGVIVRSMTDAEESEMSVTTNVGGKFQLRGVFGSGCLLHASTTDGSLQSTLMVFPTVARKVLAAPVELKLEPAVLRKISVLAQKKGAAGVRIIAKGTCFRCQGLTGPDGQADLRLPARSWPHELAAWHPRLGIAGRVSYPDGFAENASTLSLHPLEHSTPHTILVTDPQGKGIAGLDLGVSVILLADSQWVGIEHFPEGQVRTDNDGQAVVPWIPRAFVERVCVQLKSPDWKIDASNDDKIKQGITTVKARRLTNVLGRLVMPEGISPEGILVEGLGFGPMSVGVVSRARARRDGWFTLRVPADHGYVVGVKDLEWASNLWSGKILDEEKAGAARITLKAYPATPVTVRVTQGADHRPVVDGWIHSESNQDVEWVDSMGGRQKGFAGVHGWFKTDSKGEVKTGVGLGSHLFRFSKGDWVEQKLAQISSTKPTIVQFHRK